MNRKDPDKKGKQVGLYLTAEAVNILKSLDKKGQFVSAAIIEKHTYDKALNINKKFYDKSKCDHDFQIPPRNPHEFGQLVEYKCTKCGLIQKPV